MSGKTIEAASNAAVDRCNGQVLPFVELDPDNPDMPGSAWTVSETGDRDADIATGLVYAEALIQRSKGQGTLLGRLALEAVLQEIVRKNRLGPIEQGFLGRIAMAAIVASQN
jgi:hypothetical protein